VAAAADLELARQKNCMNCHAIERKVVGPAFRDVARRYAGKPEVAAMLAEKIVKGGGGAWGPVPMAANPQLKAAEARQLAEWVLTVK
jgi:cytochrome c